jgi:predicted Rossmann fold nucleotide-binding protein DprA/Smf involved in DNA uptake
VSFLYELVEDWINGREGCLLIAKSLTGSGQKAYSMLSSDEPQSMDDIVEQTRQTSSDGLATLFELEMKGFLRQLPEQAIQQNTAMSKT